MQPERNQSHVPLTRRAEFKIPLTNPSSGLLMSGIGNVIRAAAPTSTCAGDYSKLLTARDTK